MNVRRLHECSPRYIGCMLALALLCLIMAVHTAQGGEPGPAAGDEWRLRVATCDPDTAVTGLPPGYVSVFQRDDCQTPNTVNMLPAPVSRYQPPRHAPVSPAPIIHIDRWLIGGGTWGGDWSRTTIIRHPPPAPSPIPIPAALPLFAGALGMLGVFARGKRSRPHIDQSEARRTRMYEVTAR